MEENQDNKLLVFVVDTSPYAHKAFKLCLPPTHFEIKSFTDSHDAVEQILAQGPALVFVDVDSKPLNGYAISQKIKDLDTSAQNIPIVLTASNLVPIDPDRFEVSRANAHLGKPFDSAQLIKVMSQLKPIKDFLDAVKSAETLQRAAGSNAKLKAEKTLDSAKFKDLFDPQKSNIKSLDQLIDSQVSHTHRAHKNTTPETEAAAVVSAIEERDFLSSQLTELTLNDVAAGSKKQETNNTTHKTEFDPHILESVDLPKATALQESMGHKLSFNLQDQIINTVQNEVSKYLNDAKMVQMIGEHVQSLLPQIAEKIIRNEIQKLMGTQDSSNTYEPYSASDEEQPEAFDSGHPGPPMMITRTDY